MLKTRETATQELLLFEVEGGRFGIPSSVVQELVRAVAVTRLPGDSGEGPGVIDLRGRLVEVFELRERLGLPRRDLIPSDQLVIANTEAGLLAFPVDRASELVRLPVSPAGASRTGVRSGFPVESVASHPGGLIPILSLNSISSAGRINAPTERQG